MANERVKRVVSCPKWDDPTQQKPITCNQDTRQGPQCQEERRQLMYSLGKLGDMLATQVSESEISERHTSSVSRRGKTTEESK